jgi:phage shock protein PspC (stress-responsive transcriptional regulator)
LLEGDPDPQEILADLEQAVADQCTRRMRPEQTVVTLVELEPALEEIGSLQAPGSETASAQTVREPAVRSLQQVSEGAVISGVCAGLARYLNLNATLLRVVAVLLLLGTGGAMILVYLSLMVLMPYAPLQPGGEPIRWLPAKTRAFLEYIRVKLGVDRPRNVTA